MTGPVLAQDAPPDENPAEEFEFELPTVGLDSDAEAPEGAPALDSVPVPETRPTDASEGQTPATELAPEQVADPANEPIPGAAPELDSVPVPEARPEDIPAPGQPSDSTPDAETPGEADADTETPARPEPDTETTAELEPDTESPADPEPVAEAPAEPLAEAETPTDPAPDAGPPTDTPALIPPDEAAPAGPPMREVLTETPADLAACLAALDDLGVVYTQSEPITEPDNPDCGIANPVTVTEIAPGLTLEPPPTLRCDTALAAARWAQDVAIPLSRKLGRGDLTVIDQGTATLCRPRADGEMSEHAWGNAIDVMGFRFAEGEPIPVEPRAGDGTLDEAFQRAVRAGACLDFTTVLGPGSDADHADHLHLDIRDRDGDFRICE